jgi:hypothetical protein
MNSFLGIIWRFAFAIVPAQLLVMITALLCSNHVTYRFGKGMMPAAYRLNPDSMAVIMDQYAAYVFSLPFLSPSSLSFLLLSPRLASLFCSLRSGLGLSLAYHALPPWPRSPLGTLALLALSLRSLALLGSSLLSSLLPTVLTISSPSIDNSQTNMALTSRTASLKNHGRI